MRALCYADAPLAAALVPVSIHAMEGRSRASGGGSVSALGFCCTTDVYGKNRFVPSAFCRDMRHFFFHLHNSTGAVLDHEGKDLPGVDAARAVAITSVRSIISEEARAGRIDLRGRVDVVDESGAMCAVVPFSSAFDVYLGEPQQ